MRELVLMSGLALAFLAGDEAADGPEDGVVTATEVEVMTPPSIACCCATSLDVVDEDEVDDEVVWFVVDEEDESLGWWSYLKTSSL